VPRQHAARLGQDEEAGRVGPGVAGRRVGRTATAADGDDEGGHRQGDQADEDEQDEGTTCGHAPRLAP
jgi:hypothetical protein